MSEALDEQLPITEQRSRLQEVAIKTGRIIGATALSFLGGSVAMNTAGQTTEQIGPVELAVGAKVEFDRHESFPLPYPKLAGGSKLEGNLLGNVTFDTHSVGPLLVAEPKSISIQQLETTLMAGVGMQASGGKGWNSLTMQAADDFEKITSPRQLAEITGRSLGAFALGAGAVQLMLRNRKHCNKENWSAFGLSTSLIVGTGLAAYPDFDSRALIEPTFHGLSAEAKPYAMTVANLDALDNRALKTIDGYWALQSILSRQVEVQENIQPTALKIMVVSDIHSRNVYPVLKEFVSQNQIDAVIDHGDITDWGSDFENNFVYGDSELRSLTEGIDDLNTPYYFLPGNHDSDATVNAIAKLPNTKTVKKGEVRLVTIEGLRVLLAGDNQFTPDKNMYGVEEEEYRDTVLREAISQKLSELRSKGTPADVLSVHNPNILDNLDQQVNGVINGHKHYYKFTSDANGSFGWHLQEGSTGGSGLRMAQINAAGELQAASEAASDGEPYLPEPDKQQFSILHFDSSCRLTKLEHLSYDIFEGKNSEYFIELNDNLDQESALENRCGN